MAFEFPSVGATENSLMAAVLAHGEPCSRTALANRRSWIWLARFGRWVHEIEGEGTETIRIQGKAALHGCDYEIMGDRIEAGTFLVRGRLRPAVGRVEGTCARVSRIGAGQVRGGWRHNHRGDGFIEL